MTATGRKLEVRLERAADDVAVVGHLLLHERAIYFEYAPTWLARGPSISPLKLALQPGIFKAPATTRLHGVFADALPDGWGLLLMDRLFRKRGLVPEQLSPLDRLAHLGARTMGALTFHPCTDAEPVADRSIPLDELAAAAEEVYQGHPSELLPVLQHAGGSPGGARPKVLVAVRGDSMVYGTAVPPPGHEPWLVKFWAGDEQRDAGAIEHVYARLARHAGLEVPDTRLFVAASGQRFFGVRRFDRDEAGARAHVHTLAGLLDADFREPNLDYDMLLRVTMHLARAQPEVRRAFRQLVFNVLAHNRDDHGKNFSFVMDREGGWRLSPAYDLNFVAGPGGEHTMTVDGEGRRPTWQHMLRLARRASIDEKTARAIVDEVRAGLALWPREARAVDVAPAAVRDIGRRLDAVAADAELPGSGAARRPRRR
ncbi:type II toxin-antitoxin system HipA family toxin [Nannocystis punicea]|uniref:Type II toxin-antitoxin system HipA family toxin n=1 Tax=Nannocystis punicea TaxID=2995304 RepID=A0ABY7GTH8_9BACT|nr:type II toxin-antitoxin system HipA family toxin [Nannocystis poenicansa]WAS90159.1 type II toxin-antitoxin system HipA family toxin [Nannocystis poenicansa]